MKTSTVVIVVVLGLVIKGIMSGPVDKSEWEQFKEQYNKTYLDEQDELEHQEAFLASKQKIEAHNNKNNTDISFTLGLNYYSDYTEEEWSKMLMNDIDSSFFLDNRTESLQLIEDSLGDPNGQIPDSLDWRKVPERVTPVRDQKTCGSCWAFATAAMLEGQMIKHSNQKKVIHLSTQSIIDCTYKKRGCQGGHIYEALASIARRGGIEAEATYPYWNNDWGWCRSNPSKVIMRNAHYVFVPRNNEALLKRYVALYGPIAVVITSPDNMRQYKAGVYYNDNCLYTKSMHAVLVVGYGTEKGMDYWLVKNSWGPEWGERGYFKLARNRNNQCGVARQAVMATF